MTTFTKLTMHLDRHIYKSGANKGDAPADKCRRGKSHFRVRRPNADCMAVRFHNTDILTAHPNGNVTIDCRGYADHATTKAALNECSGFTPFNMRIYSASIMSQSQLVIRINGTDEYAYYDGMVFDEDGRLMTERKGFEARRIDKVESAEFMHDVVESGFKDMFPLLYATTEHDPDLHIWSAYPTKKIVSNNVHANEWVKVVHGYKFNNRRQWDGTTGRMTFLGVEVDDAKGCWKRLITKCKADMYNTIRTEVVSIP
jgi:hypothetical protein